MTGRATPTRRCPLRRRAWLVLLAWLVCLLAALITGYREYFLLSLLLPLLLLLALVQALLQKPKLSLDLGRAQVERGQAKTFQLRLQNPHGWPLFPLRVTLSLLRPGLPPQLLAQKEVFLPSYGETSLDFPVVCGHCGAYQVQLHQFYAEDLFGFFALPGPVLPPQSLLSLPKLDLTAVEAQVSAADDQDESSQLLLLGRRGQLTAESRPYQRGDSLRAIHWKKSLSRRTLFSRLREYSTEEYCCLLLDNRPCGSGEEALDREDRLREAALSFLFAQLLQGQRITLLPGGRTLQAAQELSKAAALLAALPFESDEATALNLQALTEDQRLPDTLFLLLGQSPQPLLPYLEQLVGRGCHLVCLAPAADAPLVERELTLPLPLFGIEPPAEQSQWLEV